MTSMTYLLLTWHRQKYLKPESLQLKRYKPPPTPLKQIIFGACCSVRTLRWLMCAQRCLMLTHLTVGTAGVWLLWLHYSMNSAECSSVQAWHCWCTCFANAGWAWGWGARGFKSVACIAHVIYVCEVYFVCLDYQKLIDGQGRWLQWRCNFSNSSNQHCSTSSTQWQAKLKGSASWAPPLEFEKVSSEEDQKHIVQMGWEEHWPPKYDPVAVLDVSPAAGPVRPPAKNNTCHVLYELADDFQHICSLS